MTKPAVIAGTFADLKSVKTRSVVQMIIEVPIEKAENIVKVFGFPQPGAEVPVAVALMETESLTALRSLSGTPQKPASAPEGKKPHKPFKDYPRSQQAAMACQDGAFQKWIGVAFPGAGGGDQAAASLLRMRLGIESRAELSSGDQLLKDKWDALYAQFEQDTGRVAELR